MYVTVHRLRSPAGLSGFNAFLHFHGDAPIPEAFDASSEAEKVDGTLAASLIQVPPGGNFVDSYLDIVGPDSAQDALGATLLKASARVRSLSHEYGKHLDEVFRIEPFRFRFRSSGRIPFDASHEFTVMAELIPRLLEGASERPPLTLVRRQIEGRVEYTLSHESLERLSEAGIPYEHRPVTIDQDVLEAFETLRGPFDEQVGALLLPSGESASLFQGVRILDG